MISAICFSGLGRYRFKGFCVSFLADDEVDPAEQMLRDFDLDYKFGPCLSTSRLERWERAERLGLNPPKSIKQLLDAGERNECLWAGRV